MKIYQELEGKKSIFVDTAPIIYFIEANPQFGELAKDIILFCQQNDIKLKQIKEIKIPVLKDFI